MTPLVVFLLGMLAGIALTIAGLGAGVVLFGGRLHEDPEDDSAVLRADFAGTDDPQRYGP